MENNSVTNILLVGVGGQGIIVASEIMADAFLEAGYDVKKSEVHGMAQRGGSVSTHVRFGPKVFSPLIKEGETDILVAFEELEAMRYLHFLGPKPTIILNEQRLNPPSVSLGKDRYPENIADSLSRQRGPVQEDRRKGLGPSGRGHPDLEHRSAGGRCLLFFRSRRASGPKTSSAAFRPRRTRPIWRRFSLGKKPKDIDRR